MAVLEILVYPDPRLAHASQSVPAFDKNLHKFIEDLEETMHAGPGGVGIAAPQVDVLQRIVIVDVSGKPKVSSHGRLILINPQIVANGGGLVGREGCMSVPDYTGNVVRAKTIQVVAYDEFGERQEYACEGYEARVIQHEIDHLDGLLFLDRLVSRRRDLFRRKTYA
ncbi:MAG TPA: peptide deformylase [Acidiferrobacteraceae bacterium]|nr:peptide deformylase [Acidiferrobacteraceae bacterium]